LFRHEIISGNSIWFDERFVVGNDAVFMCEYLKHTRAVHDVFAPIYIYYKFHPSERVQGMGWYYPDAFFLFAYVADKMIKIAQPDENEFKQFIIKQYKDLLYGLTNAAVNREHFKSGLMPYLTSFCNEIDLLQIGARIDLTEDYIKKEEGALPIRLISYLIVNKRFSDLYEMLQAIGRARNMIPLKGEHVRQMVQVKHACSDNQCELSSDSLIPANAAFLSGHFSFTDDKLLVEQLNEMVTTITASQRQIDAYEAKINEMVTTITASQRQIDAYEAKINEMVTTITASQRQIDAYEAKINEMVTTITASQRQIDAYEAKINDYKAKADTYKIEIEHYIQSTSWRVTKPLRVIGRLFKKIK
jgi:FtsZ-binding cell division protein ZapB